uniref:SAM domain-containing protein n=1 Tax=Onchocerca volvulus TaxID=6282 RepID=A0A8R1TUE3_ONCVO
MHSDMNLEMECQRNVITASPSSSSDLKQRSFSVNGQNSDDLLCNSCHRNSAGSSSSHDSSSGFEICGSSLGLLPHSSQSRLSVQSCSSGDASLIMNNTANLFDDSATEHVHGDNLMDISRLSFSDMMLKGVEESEILALWLGSLGYPEYLTSFLAQGYDLPTIARITPEDLTALGITHPNHRKLLISEIHRWRITDTWPTLVPSGKLRDWLPLIGLPEYVALFEDQGYCTVAEIQNFTWEDFEDIGIKKLGHLKRLGLAIKKMKAIYDDLRSHLEMPPLSAATSTFYPANLDSLYNNCSTMRKQHSHLCEVSSTESHAQKQAVQVYPHYQSLANEVVPYHLQGCDQQSLKCGLNKQKTSSLQMNLYSLSQILSDESLQKHSVIQQQSVFPARILSTADNSISSDSEDYPPPPAPLVCEGSVQLLKSAFNESAMATTTESDITNDSNFERHYDEISSFSSNEQLSFAKDNCDAVKSCNGLLLGHKCNEESTNSRFSQPNTACRRLHNSSYSTSARNGDILNDIGSMLQNLTDELDAMLLPSQSVQYSSRQIPF